MDVAHAMARHGIGGTTTEDIVTGALNPHQARMSGVAADDDALGRASNPFRSDTDRKQIEQARMHRRDSFAAIFLRLREVLNGSQNDIVTKSGGGDLVGLAHAFSQWLNAHLSGKDIQNYEAVLVTQLRIFLKNFK